MWVEPGRGRGKINLAVERALDLESDVLLTLSSWLTQTAVSLTIDMADPPVPLFASVNYSYRSGIAESPCIKPDHVTGSESLTPFRHVMSLLGIQNPDIKSIGAMFNSSEEGGKPIFHPSMGAIYFGATVGAGLFLYYEDGAVVGRMLAAYPNGELDIAKTVISVQSSEGLGVNLDAAHVQGIDLSEEVMSRVDAVVECGELSEVSPEV